MKVLCAIIFVMLLASSSFGVTVYKIQAAVDDEKFIINGEVFDAMSYCLGWDEGDRVIFLEGTPLGACSTAELYNLDREEKCSVWCE